MAERKLKEVKEGIAKLEAEQVPGPSALPLALIAHARQVYAEEEGFPRAFLLASAENPEAFAGFNAFLRERLAGLEKIETCPGIGAALVFSTLGLLITRTLGFPFHGGRAARTALRRPRKGGALRDRGRDPAGCVRDALSGFTRGRPWPGTRERGGRPGRRYRWHSRRRSQPRGECDAGVLLR